MENGQIRRANDKIADYERGISALSRKQERLYEERGVLRKTIFFGCHLLRSAACCSRRRTAKNRSTLQNPQQS